MHAYLHSQKKTATDEDEGPRRRWRRWAAASVLLFLIGGVVWAVRPDPHLSRARELQAELFRPEAKTLPPEERRAKFTELREQVKHLSDDQKWDLSAPMREKQKAEMNRYFALSPKEKVKYLDERIDKSEKMRKEFEKKTGPGKAGGPPGGFPGGGFGGPSSGGNKAGGPGYRPPLSPDEIEQRRKKMLDRTTPDERAKTDLFRKEMNDRRRQRGLPVRG